MTACHCKWVVFSAALAFAMTPAASRLAADEPTQAVVEVEVQAVEVQAVEVQAVEVQARAQQVVFLRQGGGLQTLERAQVDPQDNRERFVLFTPGGPLVVEVRLTIDGQPFRVPRELLVDEALAQADTDQDGQATWNEALANPRFALGRFAGVAQQNEQQRQALLQYYDHNGDGLADRGELRQTLAQMFGGPTFSVVDANYGYLQGANARDLLDGDGDGLLTAAELTAAPERLKSRDADDNDVLTPAELGGLSYAAVATGTSLIQGQQAVQTAMLLGPAGDDSVLFQVLSNIYQGADGKLGEGDFPLLPGLAAALDTDGNGQLDAVEVAAGLEGIPPHVELSANFGQTGDLPAGLHSPQAAAEPSVDAPAGPAVSEDAEGVRAAMEGVLVQFAAGNGVPTYDMQAQAEQLLARFDSDKNAYLELKELEAVNVGFGQQFATWDENSDGKVYAEEIAASYDRQLAPLRTQVSVSASREQDPLFAALDASGDGRLSLREVRGAAARLSGLDANGDGQISATEVPVRLAVTLSHGQAQYRFQATGGSVGGFARPAGTSVATAGPEWFVRMDRNGDGDVSPREFLGTDEQFAGLDQDQDGLLDANEAGAAQ